MKQTLVVRIETAAEREYALAMREGGYTDAQIAQSILWHREDAALEAEITAWQADVARGLFRTHPAEA